MNCIFYYEYPLGFMTLGCSNKGLTYALFGKQKVCGYEEKEAPLLAKANQELAEYFSIKRKTFDIPLDPSGTLFQKNVWNSLTHIPYGETRTYGEIAKESGNEKASRAVGLANHHNPLAIFIPCHRVIGKNGTLTGYAGGLSVKEYLLHLEKGN